MRKSRSISVDDAVTQSQQPVSDEACERLVVGTLIQHSALLDDNADVLSDDCFYNGRLRAVFHAIAEMQMQGLAVDIISLPAFIESHQDWLQVSQAEIISISNNTIFTGFREKCLYLFELARRRKLLLLGLKLVAAGTSRADDFDNVVAGIDSTMENFNNASATAIQSSKEATDELMATVMSNRSGEHQIFDYSGVRCMDQRAFLRPEALTVIAAYSGHGKSCLASTIAYNAASTGAPVAYYSLEMSKQELMARVMAPLCQIPTERLLYERLNDGELANFSNAALKVDSLPLYFDERATATAESLYLSIRQMVRQKHVKGVIVDYLQILSQNGRPSNQTEEAFLGGVVRNLKNIAKQMKIWVIVLSQLSRNKDTDEPKENYLRGSGQILEGCDNCVLLYRPSKHPGNRYSGANANVDPVGTAELNVVKARNGSDGEKFIIGFQPDYTHFEELQSIPYLASSLQ